MDEKLKYCLGLTAIYGEILFILVFGCGMNLLPTSINPFLFWLPTTIPQIIAIPFYIIGFLVLMDILPLEKETTDGV